MAGLARGSELQDFWCWLPSYFHERIQEAELEIAHRPCARKTPEKLPWCEPREALSELLPGYDPTRLEDALRKRQESKLLDPIVKLMHRMAEGELNPRLHAEVILLNHFKLKHLAFIGGDRYLGCSKPSWLLLRSVHPQSSRKLPTTAVPWKYMD